MIGSKDPCMGVLAGSFVKHLYFCGDIMCVSVFKLFQQLNTSLANKLQHFTALLAMSNNTFNMARSAVKAV